MLGLGRVPLLGARILRALDAAQAAAVAGLVARYLPHLPFRTDDPRGFPRDVVVQAASLFAGASHPAARFEW